MPISTFNDTYNQQLNELKNRASVLKAALESGELPEGDNQIHALAKESIQLTMSRMSSEEQTNAVAYMLSLLSPEKQHNLLNEFRAMRAA